MDHPFFHLINKRIEAAEAEGMFDNLPGAGKPLPRCDDPENAAMNRIMKDAGAVPPVVSLLRQLSETRARLAETTDRTQRREIITEIALLEERVARAKRHG